MLAASVSASLDGSDDLAVDWAPSSRGTTKPRTLWGWSGIVENLTKGPDFAYVGIPRRQLERRARRPGNVNSWPSPELIQCLQACCSSAASSSSRPLGAMSISAAARERTAADTARARSGEEAYDHVNALLTEADPAPS